MIDFTEMTRDELQAANDLYHETFMRMLDQGASGEALRAFAAVQREISVLLGIIDAEQAKVQAEIHAELDAMYAQQAEGFVVGGGELKGPAEPF